MHDGPSERSRDRFHHLVNLAAAQPEKRDAVTREIEALFGQVRAILVADLDSFTAATAEHGIVSFMILLRQVQELVLPILARRGGRLLKSEADTFFCLFDDAQSAVCAAVEIQCTLREGALRLPGGDQVTVAIGVGYGSILNIADEDAMGCEVNFAYKLGEDLGRAGEILLTDAARAPLRLDELPAPQAQLQERCTTVSGVRLVYHALRLESDG